MRVIATNTLCAFWQTHADAEGPLKAWFAETSRSAWHSMADIKRQYATASIIDNERVVFNVGGNKYRLVVKLWFPGKAVCFKFIGTHKRYDPIDVKKLREGKQAMEIHPIRNQRDHARALRAVEHLWGARPGTAEADKLEILVTLVDAYEAKHHPLDPPDPIDAIRFRMEQMGLTRQHLVSIIGSRARVSEILNRRRPLTIAMIARLRDKLGISADVLIGSHRRAA